MIALAASNWEPIFRQAYSEARQFFQGQSITDPTQAGQALLSQVTDIDLALLSGGVSESVWKDACRLAKQLITNFEEERRWHLIFTVCIELLVHAAFVRQLGDGGEALTVVWLLMNHLGLGNIFSEAPAPQ
ncbi:hypothetical protein Vadar_010933 [Vaccinium darrowii]|uniref:Uncharacterized protein n=1 Tax=Vaccinium darrowii TaxID=229202 RepID=A0ACB7ZBE0_9ERIC|nr:hypothetical protein Vadar_010933 [Vaccinium darrowii]